MNSHTKLNTKTMCYGMRTGFKKLTVKLNVRVALLGLGHEPPFVTTLVVEIVWGVHVARLGAVGRLWRRKGKASQVQSRCSIF